MNRESAKRLALSSLPVEQWFTGEILAQACVPQDIGFQFKWDGKVYEIVTLRPDLALALTVHKPQVPTFNLPELKARLHRIHRKDHHGTAT